MKSDLTSKLPVKEHIKNIKKLLKVVYDMEKSYFPTVCIVHIMNVIIPYAELVLSAYILDGVSQGRGFGELMPVIAAVTAIIFVLHCVTSRIWNRVCKIKQDDMYYRYSCMIESKMLQMDYSRIDSPEIRELKNRIASDNNWGAGLYSTFWQTDGLLYTVFNLIGAIVVGMPVLFYIVRTKRLEVFVILLLLLVITVICMKCRVYFLKKSQRFMYKSYTDKEREEKATFVWGFAMGDGYDYKNGKDIRIYNGYRLMKRWTTDVIFNKPFRKELKDGVVGEAGSGFFYSVINGAIEGASYLLVCILAMAGSMGVGSVVRLSGCLRNIFSNVVTLISWSAEFALTARKQMSTLEFLEMSDEMYKGKLPMEKRSDNQYQIEFRNVFFKYPGAEDYALKDFSMKLKIGEKLAIVGMNGSGKTTMIKLLCRLYDPDKGEILLNGVDIRKFKQEEYSRLFSVVFQDYRLMPFKLAENVAVDIKYDAELVKKSLCDAGFGDRLLEMESGIDTYIYKNYDDSGVEVSGGEAQKIAIARAIYKDSPFILLDEPTAALDPLSEYEIYTNFDKIIGTKTAIYISHRLSSCRFCEKIAVFHEGGLIQLGNHEELLKNKKGKYYEMWEAQARYYRENGIEMDSCIYS